MATKATPKMANTTRTPVPRIPHDTNRCSSLGHLIGRDKILQVYGRKLLNSKLHVSFTLHKLATLLTHMTLPEETSK